MELRHLRYFVAVAEAENVSRAALKLHVSQPALSRQIRDLEEEIGFPLLNRTAKSVSLTEAGRIFMREARAHLEQADQAVKKARAQALDAGGELHVGYSPTPTARFLPPTLRAFQSALPKVRVKLHDLTNRENLLQLRAGALQLAFLVGPVKASISRELRYEQLQSDPVRLAVSTKDPLARRSHVAVADLGQKPLLAFSHNDYPDYHEMLASVFGPARIKPNIVEEHDGISSLVTALEACTGAAIIGESLKCVTGNRLKFLRLEPEPPPIVVGLAALTTQHSPAVEKFWELARLSASIKG